jgi:hypothetical protein
MELINVPTGRSTLRPHTPYPFVRDSFRPELAHHVFYLPLLSAGASMELHQRKMELDSCSDGVDILASSYDKGRVTGTMRELWGFGYETN